MDKLQYFQDDIFILLKSLQVSVNTKTLIFEKTDKKITHNNVLKQRTAEENK